MNLIVGPYTVWEIDWSIFSTIKPMLFKLDYLFSKIEFRLLIS